MSTHPRDKYITVYGRKPVLEILSNPDLEIDKLVIAQKVQGAIIKDLLYAAEKRNITVLRWPWEKVNRLSRNAKQDQGVAADVIVPQMANLSHFLQYEAASFYKKFQKIHLVALDGITTPANVGMIIRTCTGLGIDGIILPRVGCPKINSLVIKASAGIVFKSRILRCEHIAEVL